MRKALSAEKSLQAGAFSAQVRAALRQGFKLEASTIDTQGAPAPVSVARATAIASEGPSAPYPEPVSCKQNLLLRFADIGGVI